jgi:hypothetical protein
MGTRRAVSRLASTVLVKIYTLDKPPKFANYVVEFSFDFLRRTMAATDPSFHFHCSRGKELEFTIGKSFGRALCFVLVVALLVFGTLLSGKGDMLSMAWKIAQSFRWW